VATLGGSVRSVDLPGNAWSPAWSPDGSSVAYIARPDSLFTYSISDRATTLLAVLESTFGFHSPVWSPDGRRIAYVHGTSSWLISFDINVSSIWIIDSDGGEPVRVTGGEFLDVSPAWLDDDHLLFISNREGLREVYVVDLGPTGPRGEPLKVPGVLDAHSISYSTAAKKLTFSKATARQNIWSYPIGSGPESIHDGFPVTSENAVIETHDISRDGEWITYHSNLRGNSDIYKKPLDGGSALPVTDSPFGEYSPQWSPDGTEIVYKRDTGDGECVVMVVPDDGGIPTPIAGGLTSNANPKWSPSGLDVAFVSDLTGQSEVWIVSRDSVGGTWGEPSQLTVFECVLQDWAPNGSGVLCASPWPPEEIVLLSRAGEVAWRYDPVTAGLRMWTWWAHMSRFSRDGSTIYLSAYHEDGLGGIWEIPLHGGEPSLVVESYEFMPPFLFSVGPGPSTRVTSGSWMWRWSGKGALDFYFPRNTAESGAPAAALQPRCASQQGVVGGAALAYGDVCTALQSR
jgi:Tol biopolymer transport system component